MVAYSEYVVITWFSFGWSSPVSVPGSSMGWHDSSGWLLYQFPRLTKYVISQFQLLPLSPGWLLLYNIGYAAPCGCIQVSRTQGTGSQCLVVCWPVPRCQIPHVLSQSYKCTPTPSYKGAKCLFLFLGRAEKTMHKRSVWYINQISSH